MKAFAEFIGYQDMGDLGKPFALFNIHGNVPANGSTVCEHTLLEMGIKIPLHQTYEEWSGQTPNIWRMLDDLKNQMVFRAEGIQ